MESSNSFMGDDLKYFQWNKFGVEIRLKFVFGLVDVILTVEFHHLI